MDNHTEWDIYEAWLYQVDGIGRQKMQRFERSGISFKEIYECDEKSLHNLIKECYGRLEGDTRALPQKIVEKDFEAILYTKHNIEAEKLYQELIKREIYYVNNKSEDYPKKLLEIPDRPYALYRKGQIFDYERRRSVLAIIGARLCSEYGKYVAAKLGEMAAQLGFEVVSGLARGVDGIAQNAARLAGGEVTAVLGCGVDICYPKENEMIYERILEKGRLISEYPPGTKPLGQNFPPRNRIIAGIADAVIVVEAKKRSGTLITVDMALEQGRDVYVIPGRVTDPMSFGCNRLIAQGAEGIVDMMETLLEIRDKSLHNSIMADSDESKSLMSNANNTNNTGLHNNTFEDEIIKCIEVNPKSVQQIYESMNQITELSLQKLQNKLIQMELFGQIIEEGGCYYKKI